jgi:hypothetical protein
VLPKLANNFSKKLTEIPCGKFCNMRFDIDNNEAAFWACVAAVIAISGGIFTPACDPLLN